MNVRDYLQHLHLGCMALTETGRSQRLNCRVEEEGLDVTIRVRLTFKRMQEWKESAAKVVFQGAPADYQGYAETKVKMQAASAEVANAFFDQIHQLFLEMRIFDGTRFKVPVDPK